MVGVSDIAGSVALDTHGIDNLKLQAKTDPNGAVKAAAQQFEALFMTMLLKSMREATPQDGIFDSEQARMYTQMLDQQFAQTLSARGVGLADVMARQLLRLQGAQPADAASAVEATTPAGNAPVSPSPAVPPGKSSSARDFVNTMLPQALEASRASGIPAPFMIGQAALETGWGRREIVAADGTQIYNLFGIKAGPNWKGPVVEVTTTEYVDGAPQKSVGRFRAYGSYAESFRDYANLLKNTPRYASVLEQTGDAAGFARGLQQAGYATDPRYAAKLGSILAMPQLRTLA
jgi:flagellar protein FlgJ